MSTFTPATKRQAKLRLALIGPAGAGKTLSALKIAQGLGKKIALIDTEHGSASKYAESDLQFDTMELSDYHPDKFIAGIKAAATAGYDVLIIDSLSHAWAGEGGVLAQVDNIAARNRNGNSFSAWREGTPLYNRLIDAILSAPLHVVCTMRAKMDYAQEKDERGKTQVRKVGLSPIIRAESEYEFDVVGDIGIDHRLVVTKSRYAPLADRVIDKPGQELGQELAEWLGSGVPDARLVKAVGLIEGLLSELDAASVEGFSGLYPLWRGDIEQATALYKALEANKKAPKVGGSA